MPLWTPPAEDPFTHFGGSTYLSDIDLLGRQIDTAELASIARGLPTVPALVQLSQMVETYDRIGLDRKQADHAWADKLFAGSPDLLKATKRALLGGRQLLAPQLLLLAMRELLRSEANVNEVDEEALQAGLSMLILGVSSNSGAQEPSDETPWGGLPLYLIRDIIANFYHNQSVNVMHSLANAQAQWRTDWPEAIAKAHRGKLNQSPAQLFRAASGASFDSSLAQAIWIWSISNLRGETTFTRSQLEGVTNDPLQADSFLARVSADLETFRTELQRELGQYPRSHWAFDTLRRFPILEVSHHKLLVLRPTYLIDRVTGTALNWEVRHYLNQSHQPHLLSAFNASLDTSFEATVGDSLRRVFGGSPGWGRLYSEDQMKIAWGLRKKKGQRICDWVVDGGHYWVCIEVTNRPLPRALVNGLGTSDDLDNELRRYVDEIEQIYQTIDLIRSSPERLTRGRHLQALAMFLPIVVVPTEGFQWNPSVHQRLGELLAQRRKRSALIRSPGIIGLKMVRQLEYLSETGVSATDTLARWRNESPDQPFDRFLFDQGLALQHPAWEREQSRRALDAVLELVTTSESGRTAQ